MDCLMKNRDVFDDKIDWNKQIDISMSDILYVLIFFLGCLLLGGIIGTTLGWIVMEVIK